MAHLLFNKFILLSLILSLSSGCKEKSSSEVANGNPIVDNIKEQPLELDASAKALYHDSHNNLWFVSENIGIYKHDGNKVVLFTKNDGIESYRILSVQEDSNGNLYFDTPEGVFRFNGNRFSELKVTETENNANHWQLNPTDLWFRMGWDKSGPYRYDGTNLYHLKLPKNEREEEFYREYPNASFNPYGLYSLFRDSKGYIWIGTSNLGIYVFDGKNIGWVYKKHWTKTPGGGDFGIRSIAEDAEGNLWICNTDFKYTLNGIVNNGKELKKVDLKRYKGVNYKADDPSYFLFMTPGIKSTLLMTNFEDGVWINNGEYLEKLIIKDNEKSIIPSSVYKDKDNVLWLNTESEGIYKFDGSKFEKFQIQNNK